MKLVANIIIAVGAGSLLTTGIFLTVNDRTGSAATALSFGFLLVVMLLLAKFRRFKGFGFEAEMWEEKQAEAEDLIDRLKVLSKAMVQQMAAYAANMGMVNLGLTISIPQFEESVAQLRAILRQVEADTSHDAELLQPLLNRIVRACCSQATQIVNETLSDEILILNTAPAESGVDPKTVPGRIDQISELQQIALLRRGGPAGPDYISSLVQLTEKAPLSENGLATLRKLRLMDEELRFFVSHHTFRKRPADPDYPWK